ncbi:MAG: hypothetical protein US62_C0018G0025 [Candidatus Woesebacteria bacterium GW2011_GWA1_37_8]|uniref:DUF202 domain-containing protein n=2 Tax=Candidatus Woeseibacteriota TaxID=1752722 RepID=A0A0G0NLK8_9BACT|nr:MAG: hypothetical protein US62_C0018G0025 [Candidatus Woesebacteria bacterium GW2011_GWA1_37_8]KKQ86784.1 MAG: hypothetical protein UT10_C0017G0026 [Candidatus Woesebacteria bacterium GW2011_GWB1_38_8b]
MNEKKNDHLARHRTILANERTLLAYIRTSLTLFIAGATFIHFFQTHSMFIFGLLFVAGSVGVFIYGLSIYYKVRLHINTIE